MTRGRFITLEGPEGGGKSTHARLVAEHLSATGRPARLVREPGGTAVGEAIRAILKTVPDDAPMCPETELLLFLASRAQLVRQTILPALEAGTHIVCDRFADSTFAYQCFGRGLDLERIIALNETAVRGLTPDLTLLLDVEVRVGFERLHQRQTTAREGKDRIEQETLAFHERVRAGFLALAARWPDRFRRVDADRPVDAVQADIRRHVQEALHG